MASAASTSTTLLSMAAAAGSFALASSRSPAATGAAFPGAAAVFSRRQSFGAVECRCAAGNEKDAVQGREAVAGRRSALAFLAGLVAVSSNGAAPARAAYGETANIFGTPKQQTGFTTYSGEGFVVDLPSKWNPSKEIEFPGQVLRYEDNFDQLSNLSVSIVDAPVKSIKDFGSPEKFLEKNSYLLGKQSYQGQTASEGGFEKNAVATASIFTADEKELGGKTYYYLEVLTRTGDGTEGGRHQCIVATVNGGKLYIFKSQAGDKRWFKGSQKFVEGAAASFKLA
ncbi:photosystem II oxygen-evolving enhancer protein 2 [Marchantia polymorpha subsp. ruderalis]|uniref:23 kDa subunit of oxygen evolving system of photosystem II n=2 Tax=Marchantia polymorpha TaxID=3197 RepID=A0A176WBP4_MARPO|nr:hypothetical protein AXG93_509s1070 [Marchantia polymorpha subsp. ruderalis]PTQ37215.1 hypothetical protein MARPO_0058s0007 [Marchantia polymorpha]BBN12463.1 hypothetical protein Mp_5g20300 [Marchantia polymorpha subsp. ruderalis]|eukprot:PTQ37215.1 hypothetical protein MARPO_0058s0007 [Marchantia polymorpha]